MNQNTKTETVAPVAKTLTVKTRLRAGSIVVRAGIEARPRGAVSLVRTY